MKTTYIGRLVNNISIEGFINKQPQFQDYEILFHDEHDVLKSYKSGIIKEISYDIQLLNNIVFKSTERVVEYITSNSEFVNIENDIATLTIDASIKYIYLPILKYLKSITVVDPVNSSFNVVTSELFKSENIVTLSINNANIPYREIELKENVLTDTIINLHLIDIAHHYNDYHNPHNVSKFQIGLSNVDNTSDLDKPISTANREFITNSINDFKNQCESYFRNHNNTISETVAELSESFNSIIQAFTDNIITDAKEQLEAVKKLGDINTLIDNKFVNFNTISAELHDNFKRDVDALLATMKDATDLMNKKEDDFKVSIELANKQTSDMLNKYNKRVEALERQLAEHAKVLRSRSN